MRDKVCIRQLQVSTIVGVHDWERQVKQVLTIDLDMVGDFSQAAQTDHLEDAIDYCAVAETIQAYCEQHHHHLLESLVKKLAVLLLDKFPCIEVGLSIAKPGAIAGASEVIVSAVLSK